MRAVGDAAAAPHRGSEITGAGIAGAFLAERFLLREVDFGLGQRRGVALTLVGQLSNHTVVHELGIVRESHEGFGDFHGARLFARYVDFIQ